MCGIVAVYGDTVDRAALDRATAALAHRGPDARTAWFAPSGRAGLGHARLSIIDLEGGRQPLANEDETVHAVVNGEIYDFERIRADLVSRGHRFRTGSDSEVLIHLYEQHGPACVEHLRGEVAFVLYDSRRDLLVAGRDRFGIKPLFYAQLGDALVFASEAKALFAYGVAPRWSTDAFLDSTGLGGTTAEDRTLFDGVRQVPPAHVLVASRRQIRTVRYWDFDYPRAGAPDAGDAADREALAAALDEAVRLRLRADVPVACYLSGGLDSCTILGLAQRHATTPIRAFTLSFDQPEYDEEPIARAMAVHAGAEYTPIAVTQHDFARDFADAVWHAERPLVNANGVAKFRLSRAVRDAGIKVVLTGEGADEVFAGYPHFRRDLLLHGGATAGDLDRLDRTNAVSRGVLMPDGDGLPLDAVRAALDGFAPTWLEAMATSGKKTHALLSTDLAADARTYDPYASLFGGFDVSRQLRGRHPLHQSMYLWSRSLLPGFILTVLGDRMEMAHSVEGRVPFLDHRVVELAAALPPDRLIRDGVEKWIVREVARPVVTDTVVRRQKHPFFAPPIAASPTGPLYAMVQDTLRGAALRDVPFFDPARVIALLDALPNMDSAAHTAIDAPLLLVFSFCILQQRFAVAA